MIDTSNVQKPYAKNHEVSTDKYKGKNRRSGGVFKPTLFIVLEAFALYLALYIVNIGSSYNDWNILTIAVTALYFISRSTTRYYKVLTRV